MVSWLYVVQVLKSGGNPYNVTGILAWPPLWMQVLFLLSHISTYTGLPLMRVIQLFLILVEAILTAVAYLLLSRHWPTRRALLTVLVGLVINPVAIILTTVHSNFDVIVGLCVLLFVWALTSYRRTGNRDDWLLACLFLGVGILAKTAPLILVPLLFVGIRRLNARAVVAGAFLLAGPVVLGLSVIFTLGPHQVLDKVIRYRSLSGGFGITGIFNLLHWPYPSWAGAQPPGTSAYTAVFGLVMLAAGCAVVYLGVARDRSLREYDLVLITAALLIAVPVLGPGYGSQYAWWWIAVVVLVFALGTAPLRLICLVLLVVASATYVVEYGLYQGTILLMWPHPAWFVHVRQALQPQGALAAFRLPLFAAYLAFLFGAAWTVARQAVRRPAAPTVG